MLQIKKPSQIGKAHVKYFFDNNYSLPISDELFIKLLKRLLLLLNCLISLSFLLTNVGLIFKLPKVIFTDFYFLFTNLARLIEGSYKISS
ncbi:hypothetical protein DF185_10430 [Marinifilum breve]|uniref:Uncharacterized protein n=1 Tax=Marinifilum breve TaxID=2184082 RepID=A0A2V3ZXU4_9BACT|nr:hypothetical protein DF185_10430 [Marinifilum breve]